MKRLKLISICLLLPLRGFAVEPTATAPAPEKLSPAGQKVLEELAESGYFKDASCAQVMNTALANLGLPKIGARTPITGRRGKYDRSKQTQEPPILNDEIKVPTGEQISIRSAKDAARNGWSIQIKRELAKPALELISVFQFEIMAGARPQCDLSSLRLTAKPALSSLPLGEMTVDRCLTDFLASNAISSRIQGADARALEWIKTDCALALHFSKEAKSAIKK